MRAKPNACQPARLRDRESGAEFVVISVGRQIVRYQSPSGPVRGEVRRDSVSEIFEVLERHGPCYEARS